MPDSGQLEVQGLHQKSETNVAALDSVIVAEKAAMSVQWKMALSVFTALFIAFLALFWETIGSMTAIWWGDRTYGHGFLIFPVSAYLIWNRRRILLQFEPRPQLLGLVLLAGTVCVWLLAETMSIQLIQHLALITIIQLLVLSIFGWSITKQILFPLFFLFFAVPFGNFLIAPLQDVTAQLSVALLRLSGIPVYLDQLFIHIPLAQFVVAEACSGIRFLISTIVLGALLANVLFESWWRRLIIVCFSVMMPIIANGLRAYGIVFLAYISDNEIAVGVDHLVYGWVFFAFVTLCLMAVAFAFRDKIDESKSRAREIRRTISTGAQTPSRAPILVVGMAAVVVMASGPAYSALTANAIEPARTVDLVELSVKGAWHRVPETPLHWQPTFAQADAEGLQAYSNGDITILVYTAFYSRQSAGSEVVNEMNRFADEEIWRRVASGSRDAILDGQASSVRVLRLASEGTKRLVWYWYWVDGQFTGNRYVAKLLQARARLFGGDPAAAVVAVAADYEETPQEATGSIEEFLESVKSFKTPLAAAAQTTAISSN